jgi:glycogen operon protein
MADLPEGSSSPLGATPSQEGVNFSLFSRHASAVELLLFDHVDDDRPARAIRIDPTTNRTYHYWHVLVPGLKSETTHGKHQHAYGTSASFNGEEGGHPRAIARQRPHA